MEMTWIEKRLVNRPAKASKNIVRVREQLSRIETGCIGDVLELGCGTGDVSSHSYSDLSAVFRTIGLMLREERKSGIGAFAHYQLVLERS